MSNGKTTSWISYLTDLLDFGNSASYPIKAAIRWIRLPATNTYIQVTRESGKVSVNNNNLYTVGTIVKSFINL
jgi:hypothetical protein